MYTAARNDTLVPHGSKHTDFGVGSIKKIQLTDFMIHSKLTLCPSSRINLLLGANGSGKSSIVCAICLGLGGDPRDMNREHELQKFIRQGCKQSEIEIVLQGKQNYDIAIRRRLTFASNSSEWYINNEKSKQEDIRKLMDSLYIQMDNPCQFLPQEKVTEFTNLDPVKLLRYTEMAMDATSYKEHQDLITEQKSNKGSEDIILTLTNNLREAQNTKNDLAKDVELFVEYQRLSDEIVCLKVQSILGKAEILRAEAKEIKGTENGDLSDIPTRVKRLEELNNKRQQFSDKLEVRAQIMTDNLNALKTMNNKFLTAAASLNKHEDTIQEYNDALDSFLKGQQNSEEEIIRLEKKIATYQDELGRTPSIDTKAFEAIQLQFNAKIQEIKALETNITETHTKVEAGQRGLQTIQKQIELCDNVQISRLDAQGYMNMRLKQAYDYIQVQASQNKFKHKVFGPVLTDVFVDGDYADQTESLISRQVKEAFIVQCKEDQDYLNKFATENKISIITMRHEDIDKEMQRFKNPSTGTYIRDITNEDLQAFARACKTDLQWMSDVIRCDPVVEAVLVRDASLLYQVVSKDKDFIIKMYQYVNKGGKLPWKDKINVSSPQNLIRFFSSKTDNSTHEAREAVHPSKILRITVDEGQLVKLRESQERIKTEFVQAQKEYKELNQRLAVCNKEKAVLYEKFNDSKTIRTNRTRLVERIDLCTQNLQKVQNNITDQEGMKKEIKGLLTKKRTLEIQNLNKVSEVLQFAKQTKDLRLKYALSVADHDKLKCEYAQVNNEYNKLRKSLDDIQNTRKKRLDEAKKLLAEADKIEEDYNTTMEKMCERTPKYIEIFSRLPKQDVEAYLITVQAQLGTIEVDPRSKRNYDIAAEKEARFESELNTKLAEIRNAKEEFDRRVDRLRTKLQGKADELSRRFGESMRRVQCQGEVVFMGGPEIELTKWGLSVRVSFRKDKDMTQLNSRIQSGGECALSTMLVLLAMQGTTPLPFRVVDEINQGMDARNERLVLSILSHLFDGKSGGATTTITTHTAADYNAVGRQLFIITPKLLLDLEHMPSLRSIVVNNGPLVHDPIANQSFFINFCSYANTFNYGHVPSLLETMFKSGSGTGTGGKRIYEDDDNNGIVLSSSSTTATTGPKSKTPEKTKKRTLDDEEDNDNEAAQENEEMNNIIIGLANNTQDTTQTRSKRGRIRPSYVEEDEEDDIYEGITEPASEIPPFSSCSFTKL